MTRLTQEQISKAWTEGSPLYHIADFAHRIAALAVLAQPENKG